MAQPDLFTSARNWAKRLPLVGALLRSIRGGRATPFDSTAYWRERYRQGRDSRPGSYGVLAQYKAAFLNQWVVAHNIGSVIEFGCGDGNQLSLAAYPQYMGFDVSPHALARCRARFAHDATKTFRPVEAYAGETAELALSLDVVYHLVEDAVFGDYMRRLFASARRFVVIYSTNFDSPPDAPITHVRHRRFTDWVAANSPDWQLIQHSPNPHPYHGDLATGSSADFFVFAKASVDEGRAA